MILNVTEQVENLNVQTPCDFSINGNEALFLMHSLINMMSTVTDKEGILMYVCQELINRLMDFNEKNYHIQSMRDDSMKNPTTCTWDDLLATVNTSLTEFILAPTVNRLTEKTEA